MKAGDRVRTTRDIIEPACGDHPALLIVESGKVGRIYIESTHRNGLNPFRYGIAIETTRREIESVFVYEDEIESVEIVHYWSPGMVYNIDPKQYCIAYDWGTHNLTSAVWWRLSDGRVAFSLSWWMP